MGSKKRCITVDHILKKAIKQVSESISKIGFWFKIAAEPSFKPEAYCCMSRI
jgi:hypothetical protein